MTNPLSGPSQAQQYTELTLLNFQPKDAREQICALEVLAKKIVPLFDSSIPKPELCDDPRYKIDMLFSPHAEVAKKYSSKYAQKCVLACPELFPYFSQFYPDLSNSFEEIVDRELKDPDWIHNRADHYLCYITPETPEAVGMLAEKLEKVCTGLNAQTRASIYSTLVKTCESQDQLTNYILKNPDTKISLYTILKCKRQESRLHPAKMCALLSQYTESRGYGNLPPWFEPQILSIKDPDDQTKALHRFIDFTNNFMCANFPDEHFGIYIKNPMNWVVIGSDLSVLIRGEVRNYIYAIINDKANKKTIEETFQTFAEKHPLNELILLSDDAQLILLRLSFAPLQGISKQTCDDLLKKLGPHLAEGAKNAKTIAEVLRLIFQTEHLNLQDKEYLLNRIPKEPNLILCMRFIKNIIELGNATYLKKETLEIAAFNDILLESCLDGEHPLSPIAQVHDTEIDPIAAKMTLEILNFEGFIKEAARDKNYELKDGQTVAQVQGCIAFCEKVLQYALETPSVLSPASLRTLQTLTGQILKLKRFGHAFSLKSMIKLPNDTVVNLEGFNETFVIPMLRATFDEFASLREDLVGQELKDFVQESLATATWHDNATDEKIAKIHKLIHDPDYKYPVIVSSGWNWHGTQVIFYEDKLYYCNRGADSNGTPGITLFKIENKEKITPEFLKRIVSRLSVEKSTYTSLEKIKEELGVSGSVHILMKEQKVGNCVYSNFKAAISILLVLGCLKSKTSGTSIYKAFSQFDKETLVEDFLNALEKAGTEENKDYAESLDAAANQFEKWLLTHSGKKQKIGTDLYVRAITLLCQRGINL